MTRFTEWLGRKWRKEPRPELARAYLLTFSTAEGRLVLQDWLDEIYCQTCPINDPQALAEHNGQRKFVQRILEAIDQAGEPGKYETKQEESWQMQQS